MKHDDVKIFLQGIDKDELLNLWTKYNEEINTIPGWLDYLQNLNDDFALDICSIARQILIKKPEIKIDKELDNLKYLVKESLLNENKSYFDFYTFDENTVNWTLYKL